MDVSFTLKLQCLTPDNVNSLDELVKSLLDASKQHEYEDLAKTDVSGGISFLSFLSGGVKASYSDTQMTMDSWGLSVEQQNKIIEQFMNSVNQWNTFTYKGTIYNEDYDYDVTGSFFCVVADCTIKQNSTEQQIHFLGSDVYLQSDNSNALATVGKLY